MADQTFDPSKPFEVTQPAPAAAPPFDPTKAFQPAAAPVSPMNFAIVNGVRVPIDDNAEWQHAERIGAPSAGQRFIDAPLSTMSVRDVVRRLIAGPNAERTPGAKAIQPDEAALFAEGKGPMPIMPLPEAEVGPVNFTSYIKNLVGNRKDVRGLDLLSKALNINKAGQITEPEFHTALQYLDLTHVPENPIQSVDEIAQRTRTISTDMDEHVRNIAAQYPHVDIPVKPIKEIGIAGAGNPIGGGGRSSSFVQRGQRSILRLFPQLAHFEPVTNAQGKVIGSKLVEDPVSVPDAAHILTSVNKLLNDRLGPGAMRRVRTDLLATDATYAALDSLATSLRKGIDEALTNEGVPGVRAFRQDQAAVIKLQRVAEKIEGQGDRKLTQQPPASTTRQVASRMAPAIATAAGAEAGGTAGALVGREFGEAVRGKILPRLTRDQAVAKAYELMRRRPVPNFPMLPSHVPGAGAAAGGVAGAAGVPGAGAGGGGGGQPALPPVGLPTAPRGAGTPAIPVEARNPVGVGGPEALPPAPQGELPPAPKFVVRPNGQVQKVENVKAGALVPHETQWPRPAMMETYKAPKDDPSFVRAVKGQYAEVLKRAETAPAAEAAPADRPLPTSPSTRPEPDSGVAARAARRAAARVREREARAEATKLRNDTLDTLTARLQEAGHPGDAKTIRARLVDDLKGIEELHRDQDAIGKEAGGSGLLKAIADYGGISLKAEARGGQAEEIAWLKELRDGDSVAGVKGVFRDLSRHSAEAQRMNAQQKLVEPGKRRAVPFGGLSLDEMLTSLKQEPGKFQNINTINDLTREIEKAARAGNARAESVKDRALADLVYHTESEIAQHVADDAGFAAFSDAVDEIAGKPKSKEK